ncbi:MAG: NAD(P)/FAD-dependent oxidoreductase [Thermoleophilia bacterium]
MSPPRPDVVVVGAGVIGLSAALTMRDRGAVVAVLDAGPPGGGQSAGPGRVFRHIHDRADLVPLAVAARGAWREAQDRFGRRFVDDRGTLLVGGEGERYARGLAAAGVAHEWVAHEDLPGGLGPIGRGLLDPGGGTIDTEAYVAALVAELGDAVRRQGADAVSAAAAGAAVRTPRGAIRAPRVLVCAGVGTVPLMRPLGVEIPLTRTVHRRVTFGAAVDDDLPCLLERSGAHGATGYVTPVPGGGVALGTAAADGLAEGEAVALTGRYFRALFPGRDATVTGVVECEGAVLAGHPEAFGLYEAGPVAAFLGGNLFKHAPAIAPLLADALLEGRVAPTLVPPEGVGG